MYDNHPLTEAARYNDAQAEEIGIMETVKANGLDPIAVLHIAQQRALRLVVLNNYGIETLEELVRQNAKQELSFTERDRQMIDEISIAFMDGIMIGWRGHAIHNRNANV